MLSQRIKEISSSITLAITAKAKELKEKGVNIIEMAAGEPDFDTPEHIKRVAKEAIDKGFTKYTPSSGIEELKKAICRKFKQDNNLEYTTDEILISCGAKHSIFNAILTLCEEKDEVIIPSPYWVSYLEMVKVAGATPVILETNEKDMFKLNPKKLEKIITSQTKLLILNSPSNPTGMVYNKNELWAISRILVERKIYCISDEIYEKIIYHGVTHTSIASLGEDIKKLTIVINGVSKAYSMTGWRIGYAAADREIIQGMSKLQSHSTSNPTSISQKASLAALEGNQTFLKKMINEFKKRRDYIVERINSIEGISCLKPQGAFYVFADISPVIGKTFRGKVIKDAFTFSQLLLEEAKVAVIPGNAFGKETHVRISYATSLENIKKGMDRIEKFMRELKN